MSEMDETLEESLEAMAIRMEELSERLRLRNEIKAELNRKRRLAAGLLAEAPKLTNAEPNAILDQLKADNDRREGIRHLKAVD